MPITKRKALKVWCTCCKRVPVSVCEVTDGMWQMVFYGFDVNEKRYKEKYRKQDVTGECYLECGECETRLDGKSTINFIKLATRPKSS